MVLPLIAGVLGAAALGYGGKSMLDEYMQRRQGRQQASRFQGALEGAQVGAGVEQDRPAQGFVGPMPEAQTTDMGILGRNLLEAGDPTGGKLIVDQAVSRQAQQQAQAANAQQFAQEQQLQAQKDAAAMARVDRQNQGALDVLLQTPRDMPIALGSPEWNNLNAEATQLNRLGSIIGRFREVMMQGGAVPGTQLAAELNSIRAEAMSMISLLEEQGVIREGERDMWLERIPDLVSVANITNMESWWPSQAGKITALADLYNMRVMGYNNAARLTRGLPQLSPIRTRMDFEDLGLRQVDPDEISPPIQGPPDLRGQNVLETPTGS